MIHYVALDMDAVEKYMRKLLISVAHGYIQVSDYELAATFARSIGYRGASYRKRKKVPELIEVYHSTPEYHTLKRGLEVGKLYNYEGVHGVGYKRYEWWGDKGKTIIRIYIPRGEDEEEIIF